MNLVQIRRPPVALNNAEDRKNAKSFAAVFLDTIPFDQPFTISEMAARYDPPEPIKRALRQFIKTNKLKLLRCGMIVRPLQ